MSEKLVTARCASPHHRDEVVDAHVVNPGGWMGKTWLLYVSHGMGGAYYIVEADNLENAIDELAESERFGHEIVIPEEGYDDYVMEFSAADIEQAFPNDPTIPRQSGWITLGGKWYAEQEHRAEYHISGNGAFYDDDHLFYGYGDGPYAATYFHPDLPEEGIEPSDLENWEIEWANEEKPPSE